jgi:acyl-CoA thioesterase FadM
MEIQTSRAPNAIGGGNLTGRLIQLTDMECRYRKSVKMGETIRVEHVLTSNLQR